MEGSGDFATGVVNRMCSDLRPVTAGEGFADVLVFPHDQPPHLVAADILFRYGLPLRPNWVPLREKSSGRLFYGHALTKETSWIRPSVPATPRAPPSARATEIPSQKLWVGNLHPRADKRCVQPKGLRGFDSLPRPFFSFSTVGCCNNSNRLAPWLTREAAHILPFAGCCDDAARCRYVVMDTRRRPSVSKVKRYGACRITITITIHVIMHTTAHKVAMPIALTHRRASAS